MATPKSSQTKSTTKTSTQNICDHLGKYHVSTDSFLISLSPKRLRGDKFELSLYRRFYRNGKTADQSKNLLSRSRYRPIGFKGGKISLDRFYRRNTQCSMSVKPQPFHDLDLQQPPKKLHTVYSPKPNFVYNLSLFTKKRKAFQSFDELRTASSHQRKTHSSQQDACTSPSSELRLQCFRSMKKTCR